jgi:hypothetical protein
MPYGRITTEFSQIEPNFNDEVGYVPRTGIRQSKVHLERNPRPGGRIRVMEPMINVIYITDMNNRLLTRRNHQMVGTRFQNGAYLNVFWNHWFDQIDQPFRVQTVTIPKGTYRYDEVNLTFNSNPARRIYEQFTFSPQTYYGGNRTDVSATLGVRLNNRASGEYSIQRNDVDGPWGAFVVNLSILRVDMALSPRARQSLAVAKRNSLQAAVAQLPLQLHLQAGQRYLRHHDELQTDTLAARSVATGSSR